MNPTTPRTSSATDTLASAYDQVRLTLEQQKYSDEQKRLAAEAQKRQEQEAERTALLDACTADAERQYMDYMKLNGTTRADGAIFAAQHFWDSAEKNKQTSIENCYRRYPAVR